MQEPTDLDQLREAFPSWRITEHRIEPATGPGAYYIHAENDATDVNASSVAELARFLREAEADDQVEQFASDVPSEHRFTVRRILRRYRSGRMSPSVALTQLRGVR